MNASASPEKIKTTLRRDARDEGFDAFGVADAALDPTTRRRLSRFLELGFHGDMEWMETSAERRSDPRRMWEEARSAILLGMRYGPSENPMSRLKATSRAAISVYALGDDYHEVMKPKLKRLARRLSELTGKAARVFVDTAPLMEKPLAQAAGIGWQGKHTNLVSRDEGSWLFLGAILSAASLPPDAAEADRCGSCRACLDACPTDAFPAPYRLDARRCVSYLTIESKGTIPIEFREPIGNRIFGCDDCLAVCPWNRFAKTAREARLRAREARVAPELAELAELDETRFRDVFRKSPIRRTGRDRFLRNVMIALGNVRGDAHERDAARRAAEGRVGDESPLVRAMAAWALSRLLPEDAFARRAEGVAARGDERDADVRREWGLSP